MIRRPPRSTLDRSSAASDVYKRQAPYYITDRPYGNESTQFVDLNGDGLPDLVYNLWIGDGVLRRNAWLNTGTGWVEAPAYAPPYYLWSRGYDDEGMKFVDLNGDGLPDLVRGLWANGQYLSLIHI